MCVCVVWSGELAADAAAEPDARRIRAGGGAVPLPRPALHRRLPLAAIPALVEVQSRVLSSLWYSESRVKP